MLRIVKEKYMPLFFLWPVIFLAGALLGVVFQKTFGVGNALRAIGISYPTSVPSGYSAVSAPLEIPEAYRGTMSLFILAGQSNMVGWASLPPDQPTDPRVFVFGNDYHWRAAIEPIDSAYNQVDKVSEDRIANYGPSLAFALASLERHPQGVIGLIPCAKNSSAIAQWQRNLSDQSLYGSCLKRARAAAVMGHISGVLFFQGETDAVDPVQYPLPEPHAFDWATLFTAFVSDLRHDLHQPELPVVFAQIAANTAPEAFTNWKVVQDQQSSVKLPMTAMITTADLPLLDGLHFTEASYRTIGERFADAYWQLLEPESSGH